MNISIAKKDFDQLNIDTEGVDWSNLRSLLANLKYVFAEAIEYARDAGQGDIECVQFLSNRAKDGTLKDKNMEQAAYNYINDWGDSDIATAIAMAFVLDVT